MTVAAARPLRRRLFAERHGNLTWDGVLRGTGVLALLAIPAAVFLPLSFGGLIGFAVMTVWVNGPLAMFLPATYEPILMLFGRLYPPLLIALIGVAGTLYVEFLNYHLYARLLHLEALRVVRQSRIMEWLVRLFARAPFFTVWLCALTPLPYWAVRILGPMADYPVRRYLVATFLGRFPRLWFFAALGAWWSVDPAVLGVISAGSILLAVAVYAFRRVRPRVQREPEPVR